MGWDLARSGTRASAPLAAGGCNTTASMWRVGRESLCGTTIAGARNAFNVRIRCHSFFLCTITLALCQDRLGLNQDGNKKPIQTNKLACVRVRFHRACSKRHPTRECAAVGGGNVSAVEQAHNTGEWL